MKKKSIYTLLKCDAPIMEGKTIISDARVGGIKLVYSRKTYPVKQLKLLRYTVDVPTILYKKKDGSIGIDITVDSVVFLRPYKKNWTHRVHPYRGKEKVPFHLWGKKDYPLTNMWVELMFDYTDITKQTPMIKKQLEDQSPLVKFLRQRKEKFTLIT